MILDAALPVRCPVCGHAGAAPCSRCIAHMRPAGPGPLPPGLDVCRSLLAYDGAARELVARLKYRNDRAALAWLAGGMAALMEPPPGLVVTWAPTSGRRRRRRGFDQAEVLAAAVARRWRVPCCRLLDRPPGPPQTGLSLAARRRAPSFVPAPSRLPARWAGPVVVVDDVVTTGSTLTAAAWAVRAAGSAWVGALTAARTPRMAATPPFPPTAIPALPATAVPLSVPAPPPDVESLLKFLAQPSDIH